MNDVKKCNLVVTRIFDAPVQRVWKASLLSKIAE